MTTITPDLKSPASAPSFCLENCAALAHVYMDLMTRGNPADRALSLHSQYSDVLCIALYFSKPFSHILFNLILKPHCHIGRIEISF